VQTFLPYRDFHKSMRCLDPSRLGNQVYRECLTLINGGWNRHPASMMWRGYRRAFAEYCMAGLDVLAERGTAYEHFRPVFQAHWDRGHPGTPNWLGNREFHKSHKSNLLRKDHRYYGKFRWTCGPGLPYIWPCSDRAHMTELF
jgi:hypothetical protein